MSIEKVVCVSLRLPPLVATTWLHLFSYTTAVSWLFDHGADVDADQQLKDSNGLDEVRAPLWHASQGGKNAQLAQCHLINSGANVNSFKKSPGTTPFFIAAQNGHTALATLLL